MAYSYNACCEQLEKYPCSLGMAHYFFEGVGVGQFPKTNSCTGNTTERKAQGEPWRTNRPCAFYYPSPVLDFLHKLLLPTNKNHAQPVMAQPKDATLLRQQSARYVARDDF